MKKSMNESTSPLNASPLNSGGDDVPLTPPVTDDRVQWGKLFFSEGGVSLFVIFPLVMLYFLGMAAGVI